MSLRLHPALHSSTVGALAIALMISGSSCTQPAAAPPASDTSEADETPTTDTAPKAAEAPAAKDTLPPGIVPKADPTTFVEAVGKINATPAFFEALAKQPDHGATINLNLLRYRPRGDSSRYDKYGAVAGEGIVGVGGEVVLSSSVLSTPQEDAA